ncbi:hypothetical protein [Kribbella sp. NPDC050459]|uniref:hypothetical protein n=1 Tax=Kribbella sp. NPDC050459 TaxID=3155785 RepID=UPI0033D29B2B
MTDRPAAGRAATPADLRRAQQLDAMRRTELLRVRTAATQWRNGLAGLLVALIGFSLVKGRSDISELASGAAVAVGLLLLLALAAGASGALYLLRAANGRPSVVQVSTLPPGPIADHREAQDAARALRRGIALSLTCAALLTAAVATTWYGPAKDQPMVELTTDSAVLCGAVIRIDDGQVTLRTSAGERLIELGKLRAMRAVGSCPGS